MAELQQYRSPNCLDIQQSPILATIISHTNAWRPECLHKQLIYQWELAYRLPWSNLSNAFADESAVNDSATPKTAVMSPFASERWEEWRSKEKINCSNNAARKKPSVALPCTSLLHDSQGAPGRPESKVCKWVRRQNLNPQSLITLLTPQSFSLEPALHFYVTMPFCITFYYFVFPLVDLIQVSDGVCLCLCCRDRVSMACREPPAVVVV